MAKTTEEQREENRRKYPEVARIMDELRRWGLDGKVTYMGPVRPETEKVLNSLPEKTD